MRLSRNKAAGTGRARKRRLHPSQPAKAGKVFFLTGRSQPAKAGGKVLSPLQPAKAGKVFFLTGRARKRRLPTIG